MKVHRKLIVAYVLTGLFPMCLMFTLFYTQMRRVLVEREIKNLQTTFDQAVDDVNTELALHQSMSDYLAFDQTIVQIVKAEDKNSFEAYERMVKEFDPMMDSLSYFYPEIRQSTVYVRDFVIPQNAGGPYIHDHDNSALLPLPAFLPSAALWSFPQTSCLLLSPGTSGQ